MCTAISYKGLAGRTLDLEYSFCEEVAVTPRGFEREYIFEGSAYRNAEGDSCLSKFRIIAIYPTGVIELVEKRRKINRILCDLGRIAVFGRINNY